MSKIHARAYELGFSLNKQAVFATGVADGKINKMRAVRGFAPSTEQMLKISDRQWFGKGNSWATFSDRIQRSYVLPSVERSCTTLELLWALAFVLGKKTSSRPNSGSNPSEWQHVFEFQDIATNISVLWTSLFEKMGGEWQNKLTGAWLSQFTLTLDRNDHVKLTVEGGGRNLAASTATMPSMSTGNFFTTLLGSATFGPTGAEVDISSSIIGGSITCSQSPEPWYAMGNTAGQEMYLSDVHIGDQIVSGSLNMLVSKTLRDYFLNQTECGLTLTLKSKDTIDSNKHSCVIEIPHIILGQESFGQEGSMVSWTLNLDAESVLKIGSDPLIRFTVLSNIDNTELLVAG